ncbi:MAG: hypothetical protein A2504_10225 [Bdellovibrionales bacterium RIFOXYD12_FULL_39_22]|nr:MAG: hypothetical protein A2385_15030 [Bdellovibrionales bacterium RIFOXYB1_FULL_39_21]OFZ46177.1 MAG: hypothetical protein A2404_01165 [Bdellovibrionales bacterium RIFOXYC1_FULL_39_130]OFZ74686.1 MAG: hypothetical protein A2560_10695 [Bdellovibrionales bacterium RIFOXYD1_FULL_39_84]OFZ94502.1 MAG: hypothetical protein A2504_10225 [Bdellovibrionales bacterium RIFOXYD12_FULL_39_22]
MSDELIHLQDRLKKLDQERAGILDQISKIHSKKSEANVSTCDNLHDLHINKAVDSHSSQEKRNIFLGLFRCRKDVYPKLWENIAQNKKGYSPVCKNEWIDGICPKKKKVKIKCGECTAHAFLPLDELAIKSHLQGTNTIGTYAIRDDDSCIFLACDFDGDGWKDDVISYKNSATALSVEVSVEISRSGNGAHAWIFFNDFIPAKEARQLGTLILSRANEDRPQMKLASYDRFFPNQDFIPKGGFGNLIALPLQRQAREKGRTVFVDDTFTPFENPWEYLANVKKLSLNDVTMIIAKYLSKTTKASAEKNAEELDDFQLIIDDKITEVNIAKEEHLKCASDIHITIDSNITIPLEGMPSKVIAKIKRMATFSNPEFYRKNRMRMSTYDTPRLIFTGQLQNTHIIIPTGLKDMVLELFKKIKAKVILHDKRPRPQLQDFNFNGELTPIQQNATEEMLKHEGGVLVAPPGAGKTVMACAMIASRKVPTLIIVNKDTLLTQWKERLSNFLNLDPKKIGIIKGSKKRPLGTVDVAMMQTLTSYQDFTELPSYGQIIVDECHHIPCVTFEDLLKRVPAQYLVGLTATPYRKDRLEKIIYFYCGPIRHEITTSEQIDIPKIVKVKKTNFKLPEEIGAQPPIHIVWEYLIKDDERNNLIISDILAAINLGRVSLIISDRKEQLKTLEEKLLTCNSERAFKIFKLESGEGKKKRAKILEEIDLAILAQESICLFATSALIGEGFDLPRLDTLFLPMPLSFKGRMVQYAGRLHRKSEEKKDVLIHDYLDINLPLTLKMYRNRQKTYKNMGYILTES